MEQASYSWTVRARVSNQARELGSLTSENGNVLQDHLFPDAAKYTVMVNMTPPFLKNNFTYADSAALRNALSTAVVLSFPQFGSILDNVSRDRDGC